MPRFALDIDTIAFIRNMLDGKNPDPVHALVLAELGGAESIVCYLRDDLKTVNEADVQLLRQVVKSYLNVRSNITEENIRTLMRIKPDMITFVSPGDESNMEAQSVDLNMYSEQVKDFTAEFRSSGILSSVLIDPSLTQVKMAAKLEFDYVEFNAGGLTDAPDMNEELEILEEISGLTVAANKLGMGVNISGGIGYDNIKDISRIDFLEDIIAGRPVFSKSISIGIEQAVRDLIALI